MYRCYNEGEERGRFLWTWEIYRAISTTTHYSTYYFDSVYTKATELLTIYKEIF